MSGWWTAIYAGFIGLTAVVLAVEARPDKTPAPCNQAHIQKTPSTSPDLAKIRLELPLKLIEPPWTMDHLRRRDPGRLGIDEKPISQIRLFDSDRLAADWRNGRVQYVVKGVNPWGASVGGQVGTSTGEGDIDLVVQQIGLPSV